MFSKHVFSVLASPLSLDVLTFEHIDRDEEKKMGTLNKENFCRPDRANTMVIEN